MRQLKFWDLVLLAGVGYVGYKMGQNMERNKQVEVKKIITEEPEETFNDEADEEIYVVQVLKDLKNKPNKTKQDQYNIGLLEVKLQQLRRSK